MKRLSIRALVLLAVLALLGQARARADLVGYTYQWSVSPSPVLPSGTGNVSLALTDSVPVTTSSTIGDPNQTVLSIGKFTTSSSATNPPDTFSTSYSLTMDLTDNTNNQKGQLTFKGTITGQLTSTTSSLTTTFGNQVTQQATLGGHIFTVTIDPLLINLPAPGADAHALIDALVSVSNTGTNNPPPKAPEPSSLVLGGIAMSLMGLAARRRRRAQAGR